VRVADRPVLGHCRTPSYLRGKAGVIASEHGTFRDPESLAYHKPGLPAQVLYKVRFRQRDIWAGYTGPASDQLEADIFEHWLEPLEPFSFQVTHVGRGGSIACRCGADEIVVAIAMLQGGAFSVFLRGALITSPAGKTRRFKPDERQRLQGQLRPWLDATGRQSWEIEP
jgi:nitrile hydratase